MAREELQDVRDRFRGDGNNNQPDVAEVHRIQRIRGRDDQAVLEKRDRFFGSRIDTDDLKLVSQAPQGRDDDSLDSLARSDDQHFCFHTFSFR